MVMAQTVVIFRIVFVGGDGVTIVLRQSIGSGNPDEAPAVLVNIINGIDGQPIGRGEVAEVGGGEKRPFCL